MVSPHKNGNTNMCVFVCVCIFIRDSHTPLTPVDVCFPVFKEKPESFKECLIECVCVAVCVCVCICMCGDG